MIRRGWSRIWQCCCAEREVGCSEDSRYRGAHCERQLGDVVLLYAICFLLLSFQCLNVWCWWLLWCLDLIWLSGQGGLRDGCARGAGLCAGTLSLLARGHSTTALPIAIFEHVKRLDNSGLSCCGMRFARLGSERCGWAIRLTGPGAVSGGAKRPAWKEPPSDT